MSKAMLRQMTLPAVLMLVCLNSLLTGSVQAESPVQISNLMPVTVQNADHLQYLDTVGFYGMPEEIIWRDNHALSIGSVTGVRLYDADHLDATPQLETTHFIPSSSLSPDGKFFYVDGWPNLVFYDAQTDKAVKSYIKVHTGLVLSPDWQRIVSFSYNGAGWGMSNPLTDEPLSSPLAGASLYSVNENIWDAEFSPDSTILATASGMKAVKFAECSICQQMTLVPSLPVKGSGIQGQAIPRLRFSPDGKLLLLLASDQGDNERDNTVTIWDVVTGKELIAYDIPNEVLRSFAFSPDNSTLAITTESRDELTHHLYAWSIADVLNGQPEPGGMFAIPHEAPGRYIEAGIGLRFSPALSRLALLDTDKIAIWDMSGSPDTWHMLAELPGYIGKASGFSPDDTQIAYAGYNGQVHVWDISGSPDTWVERGAVDGYYAFADDGYTALLPDGSAFVRSIDGNCKAVIWKVEPRELTDRVFDHCLPLPTGEHPGILQGLALSPDGTKLVTFNNDAHNVRIWDVQTGAQLSEFSQPDMPDQYFINYNPVMFTSDGQALLIVKNDEARKTDILDAASGELLSTIPYFTTETFVLSPDGRQAASVDEETRSTVRLWDVATGTQRLVFNYDEAWIGGLAFSPDGTRLALGGIYTRDPTIMGGAPVHAVGSVLEIRETSGQGNVLMTFKGHEFGSGSVSFSPDGQLLVSASVDRTVRLWDAATGQQVALLHDSEFTGFSADSRLLATTRGDGLRFYGVPR